MIYDIEVCNYDQKLTGVAHLATHIELSSSYLFAHQLRDICWFLVMVQLTRPYKVQGVLNPITKPNRKATVKPTYFDESG